MYCFHPLNVNLSRNASANLSVNLSSACPDTRRNEMKMQPQIAGYKATLPYLTTFKFPPRPLILTFPPYPPSILSLYRSYATSKEHAGEDYPARRWRDAGDIRSRYVRAARSSIAKLTLHAISENHPQARTTRSNRAPAPAQAAPAAKGRARTRANTTVAHGKSLLLEYRHIN